jgi:hypothetical protein
MKAHEEKKNALKSGDKKQKSDSKAAMKPFAKIRSQKMGYHGADEEKNLNPEE